MKLNIIKILYHLLLALTNKYSLIDCIATKMQHLGYNINVKINALQHSLDLLISFTFLSGARVKLNVYISIDINYNNVHILEKAQKK